MRQDRKKSRWAEVSELIFGLLAKVAAIDEEEDPLGRSAISIRVRRTAPARGRHADRIDSWAELLRLTWSSTDQGPLRGPRQRLRLRGIGRSICLVREDLSKFSKRIRRERLWQVFQVSVKHSTMGDDVGGVSGHEKNARLGQSWVISVDLAAVGRAGA